MVMRFMARRVRASAIMVLCIVLVGCSAATPASPTAPSAKTTEAPKPAASPAAAASPSASPAASPAAGAPAGAAAAPLAKPSFNEQAVAGFYRGKTVKTIVGFAPGGGYDTFARVVAKHMPKYLPGSPTFIVENRPGAGSIVAANAVYSTEPKDGTIIAAFAELVVLSQAAGTEGIQFDSAKFNWLGANTKTAGICMVRKDSGINSIADAQGSRQINTPSTGRGSSANDFPAVLNGVLDTKFKLILGYQGYPEAQAAFEKNEGEALCGTVDVLVTRQRRLVEGSDAIANVLIHSGAGGPDMQDPIMRGVPNAMDLVKNEEGKQLLQALNVPMQMIRPLAVAPEVPADRVTALRYSLAQVFRDPEFDADIKTISPTYTLESTSTGEEVENIVKSLFNLPAPVLTKLKELLQ
ncbi:MAG TPA: hypothetical protein VHX16_02880 [Chloroflexota bacterium]|nr:hypothetical protein [Chloroflexota bacterium]